MSIAIQASQFVFQFYKEGVITDSSCGSSGAIDHGVLAVGYGTDVETQVRVVSRLMLRHKLKVDS